MERRKHGFRVQGPRPVKTERRRRKKQNASLADCADLEEVKLHSPVDGERKSSIKKNNIPLSNDLGNPEEETVHTSLQTPSTRHNSCTDNIDQPTGGKRKRKDKSTDSRKGDVMTGIDSKSCVTADVMSSRTNTAGSKIKHHSSDSSSSAQADGFISLKSGQDSASFNLSSLVEISDDLTCKGVHRKAHIVLPANGEGLLKGTDGDGSINDIPHDVKSDLNDSPSIKSKTSKGHKKRRKESNTVSPANEGGILKGTDADGSNNGVPHDVKSELSDLRSTKSRKSKGHEESKRANHTVDHMILPTIEDDLSKPAEADGINKSVSSKGADADTTNEGGLSKGADANKQNDFTVHGPHSESNDLGSFRSGGQKMHGKRREEAGTSSHAVFSDKSLDGTAEALDCKDLRPTFEKETCTEAGNEHAPQRALRICARKKLLVLDLNGLLCDVVRGSAKSYLERKRVGKCLVFKRPFCDDFLKFCCERFDIGVWSSRQKINVDGVVNYIMADFRDKLLFRWDASHCTLTGFKAIPERKKPLVLKELKKLWNKKGNDLPWENGDYSPANTLLIDDSPYKALCNPPHTAIFPYSYDYMDVNDSSLGPGGEIRVYLEGLALADDVQCYVREHPFGQRAITTANASWKFYEQILIKFGMSRG